MRNANLNADQGKLYKFIYKYLKHLLAFKKSECFITRFHQIG